MSACAPEEGDAVAGAAQQRAGEQRRERVQREGEDERHEPGDHEREARALGAGRSAAARDEQLRGARGGQQRRRDRPEQGEVAGVEQLRRVAGHHRQVQGGDHPHRPGREARPPEPGPDVARHRWALHAPAPAAGRALGDGEDGDRRPQRQDERDEVAEHARRGRPLRQRAREQRPCAAAGALDEHRVQRRAAAIAVGLELDQSRRRRARDHPHRHPLDRARAEQPRRVLGRGEEREADGGHHEAGGDHALAPDAVRQLPAEQQRRYEHDHVGREDEREDDAREPEALAVDGVQRRRQIAAQQQREERERQDEEGPTGAFGHLTQLELPVFRRRSKPYR